MRLEILTHLSIRCI